MDTLQELKRQRGVVVRNILSNIQLPASDGIPVYPEAEIEKAVSEGTVQVFTAENLSLFKINLQKAEADANGDPDILAEIQKARRDISKLVKVKKQDKRGKMTTVYVRAHASDKTGETIKMHPADSAGAVAQTKGGKDVPQTIEHRTLGKLSHHSSVTKEDGIHHHYHDKDGLRHTFVEDHDKKEEPKKHKDLGKIHPVDWDGPSKVKVVDADDKHVHVKRVGKDGKELEGDEHNMSYTHDEWRVEKQSGKALHNQDPKAFGDEPKKKKTDDLDAKIASNKKQFELMNKFHELDNHEVEALGLQHKPFFNLTDEEKGKVEAAHANMAQKYEHNGTKLTKSEARRLKHLADTDPQKAHKEAQQYSDSYTKAHPDQKMFGQPVSEIKAEYDAVADYAKGKLKKDGKKTAAEEFNDGVREWSGDEYTDEMIASVAEGYGEPDSFEGDLAGFAKMVSHAKSQESQSRQVHSAVDDLFAEIQPNNWHKDLDEQGVKDILWGMIMHKLNKK